MSLDWNAPFRYSQPVSDLSVKVEGDFPPDLRGRLIRTTPAGLVRGDWRAAHWFDGLCMLYRFDLGAECSFRSAWLDCDIAKQIDSGQVSRGMFDTPRNPPLFKWLLSPIPTQTDNCNVNMMRLGDRILALTETNDTLEIDPQSLAVKGRMPWSGDVSSHAMDLAHPRYHQGRKEVITVCSKLGPTSRVSVASVSAAGERNALATWETRRWPYIHDFGLTQNYAVLIAHPASLSAGSMLWSKQGLGAHLQADDSPTRLIVLPLDGGKERTFETDPGFVFHLFNSFEREDEIVMDTIWHDDPELLARLRTEHIFEGTAPLGAAAIRLRLNLKNGTVKRESQGDIPCEFPQINYRRAHLQDYQYGYGAHLNIGGDDGAKRSDGLLVKYDMKGGRGSTFGEDGWLPGEPLFVGKKEAGSEGLEDDGYLLSVASHATEERAQLWILEASDLSMRARVSVDAAIPLGFHGQFFSA